MKKQNILLIEPSFPYPTKSKHEANSVHKNFIPVGLLKIGAYHRSLGNSVKLVRGKLPKLELKEDFDTIMITTLFTYWSSYVWDTVQFYRKEFPKSQIVLGGVYATLHHKKNDFTKLLKKYDAKVCIGLHPKAENFSPDYSLMEDIDYHIMHGMRGCIRNCDFCGTWRIEPKLLYKTSEQIEKEIIQANKNKVIFFDNNFLANKNRKEILKTLASIRLNNKPIAFESQSGFDGRLLAIDPEVAILLKKARFNNVRIAWDNDLSDRPEIEQQLKHLTDAGYNSKEISVFMLYNFDLPINQMIEKIKYCLKWGVQITDCRFRPLSSTKDDYKPHMWRKGQTSLDYHIHDNWTDRDIRLFRKIVRLHNITIRYVWSNLKNISNIWQEIMLVKDPLKLLFYYEQKIGYRKDMEKWSAIHSTYKFFKLGRPPKYDKLIKSKLFLNRIKKMNRIKNYYKKIGIKSINLDNISKTEVDNKLDALIEKLSK